MKKTTFTCFLALLCLFGSKIYGNQGQVASTPPAGAVGDTVTRQVKPLEVGDQVPDLLIENVLNHPKGEIRLSDYRGKLLILDFWATWCAPCVKGFPKLDSLQQEFAGKLEILAVTYQSQVEVDKLFSRLKGLRDIEMPIAVSDNTLRQLFPHRTLPHYVWIAQDGKVLAITGPEEVTEANIAQAIKTGRASLRQKSAMVKSFSAEVPLLLGNRDLEKPLIAQSALTGYIEGVSGMYYPTDPRPEKGVRISMYNLPLAWVFRYAHFENTPETYFGDNRMVYEVADLSDWINKEKGEAYLDWLRDGHGFCYELILPFGQADKRYTYMQQDLDRYFPQYLVRREKRLRPVWVLQRIPGMENYHTQGGEETSSSGPTELHLQNFPIRVLLNQLNIFYLQRSERPVVDETGITENIDLHLTGKLSQIASLKAALNKHGLDLVQGEREIEVLVIKDRPLTIKN
ncbi:redoxin domain-containing protein [Echinicola sp. CAU 1574]|uniref:Redoxin domain-containing protein n=1 Tax=Echinicola arenosa TaxID=2774144 RepID=A0ABR9AMQ0_9BACT|nr:redoxin domain-containing protein [Echinicola arenosa]MBD8490073.1 redoxin domain-containing protein [Echinicola arenosa]